MIRFEGSPQVIATGAPNSPWRSYRPNSARWAAPGQGTVLGPTIATPGLAGQRIFQNTRIRCGSIWGTYEDDPTLSYAFTYLILEIK